MFSPFLRKPFEEARKAGIIPKNLDTIAGTWGAIYDSGDLTYLNLVHLLGYDGTDPDDLTRGEMEGRKQAMMAIEAMRVLRLHEQSRKRRMPTEIAHSAFLSPYIVSRTPGTVGSVVTLNRANVGDHWYFVKIGQVE